MYIQSSCYNSQYSLWHRFLCRTNVLHSVSGNAVKLLCYCQTQWYLLFYIYYKSMNFKVHVNDFTSRVTDTIENTYRHCNYQVHVQTYTEHVTFYFSKIVYHLIWNYISTLNNNNIAFAKCIYSSHLPVWNTVIWLGLFDVTLY